MRRRGVRALGGLSVAALALTGCAGGPERIEPNGDGSGGGEQLADAPEVESVLNDLFTAIDEGDEDRLGEMLPNYDDVEVQVPDVAPVLDEIGEVSGDSGAYDGASVTVPVTYTVAGEQTTWDAQLRYVSSGENDAAWQVTNAIVEVATPKSSTGGDFAEFEVAPVTEGIELDAQIDSLPGAYTYEVAAPSDYVEVTSEPIEVPVFVGEKENVEPPNTSEIAEQSTVALSAAGIDAVSTGFKDVVSMCSNWCDEPALNSWQAVSWSSVGDGTGIFTITSASGSSDVSPVSANDPGDWAQSISDDGGTAATLYAEVSPVSFSYSQADCSGSSSCSVSNSDGLPIDRDGVRLLYRVSVDGELTLVDVLGNT